MLVTANNFMVVFWIAVIPAFIAFALMVYGVEEPAETATSTSTKPRLRWRDAKKFSSAFWSVVVIASVFTLARFSEAFLILKAQAVGLPVALVPAIMVVMNIVYALVSYPAVALSDRIGRNSILMVGIGMLIIADVILALGTTVWMALLGVVFWGLHMSLTQGLFATLGLVLSFF